MAIERSATTRLPPRSGGLVNRPAPMPLSAPSSAEIDHDAVENSLQSDFTGNLANNDEVAAAAAQGVAVQAIKKVRRARGPNKPRQGSVFDGTVGNPKQRLKELTDSAAKLRAAHQADIAALKAKYQPLLDELRAEYNALTNATVSSTFGL